MPLSATKVGTLMRRNQTEQWPRMPAIDALNHGRTVNTQPKSIAQRHTLWKALGQHPTQWSTINSSPEFRLYNFDISPPLLGAVKDQTEWFALYRLSSESDTRPWGWRTTFPSCESRLRRESRFQSRLWGSCHNQVQIILSFQPVLQRLGPNPTNLRSCDFSEKVQIHCPKSFREIDSRSQLTVKRKGVLHDFHMQNSQETASKTQSQSYLRGCPQDSREWWSTRHQVHQVNSNDTWKQLYQKHVVRIQK